MATSKSFPTTRKGPCGFDNCSPGPSSVMPGPASTWSASGAETGDAWNTWVYGVAPDAVSRVDVMGFDGEGGRVVDGAWVIVLRERDLTPMDIQWRFLDPVGAVLESGSGIFPLPP